MLGDFVFQGWEIPESITWGGSQSVSVHKLVGGKRVVDTLGRDDAAITWSGIFLGPEASLRADQLDRMRVDGFPLPLMFDGRSYTVVISRFTVRQLKQYHLTYQIECLVQTDGTDDGDIASPDLLGQMTADLGASAIIGGTTGLDGLIGVAGQIATSQGLLSPLTNLVSGTASALGISQAVGAAQGAVSTVLGAAGSKIEALAGLAAGAGSPLGTNLVGTAIANLSSMASVTGTAAGASAISGYLGRAVFNMSN